VNIEPPESSLSANFKIIAKTLFGLEEVLAREIRAIDGRNVEVLNRAVRFEGTTETLYKANLQLRTALRILKPVEEFRAFTDYKLYRKASQVDWSRYLSNDLTFAIDATTSGEVFRHSKFVALKIKDAIVDQFRDKTGVRPSVDTENPDVRFNVHINEKDVTIALDSSGSSLDKRGYKLDGLYAPMSEVLAAGIIQLTEWDGSVPLVDAMTGSGTLAIEAAHLAGGIAPGKLRSFAFQKWTDFDPKVWEKVKNAGHTARDAVIYAQDYDEGSLEACSKNVGRAHVEDQIQIRLQDFFTSAAPADTGVLIMNPPYGDRLGNESDMVDFYKKIGDRMKQAWSGWEAWIFSGNIDALKQVGLRPSKKVKLFNGPTECRLFKFELYSGTRKKG
jgi:putative N6-adenine-specific DNA methylase